MRMNLCSVLIRPSPDVSFGCSLEGQKGSCVILTKIHKSHFFVEVDFYNSWFRKTCWIFKSLFFSFSSLSPIFFIAGLAVSLNVFLCLNERVFVGSCQDICSLLHLSVVCGIGGELEWLLWVVIWKTIYACGSIGSRAIMQPFSLSLSLYFFVCLSFWLSFLMAHFSFSFSFPVSLRSK